MKIIIGLAGAAGAGKDTVRHMLEEEHGFVGLAFADPVRDMARALLAHVYADHFAQRRELKETAVPVLGVSYREIAQTLGTEWGRNTIRPLLWADIATAKVRLMLARGERRVVISDVRFPDEAEAIRSMGGVVWVVTRQDAAPVREHVSEYMARTAESWADAVIRNDGTLEELRERVAQELGALVAKVQEAV